MPIVNGNYVNPGWKDNAPPAINAAELNAISDKLQELDRWSKRTPLLISSYTVAGSYVFTVPNNVTKILVAKIGGGGGGGGPYDSSFNFSSGGSGVADVSEIIVTPGQQINAIVGSGGTVGKAGSSTAFNGISVDGGDGGKSGYGLSSASGANGGQGSSSFGSYQWLSKQPIFGGVSTMFAVNNPALSPQGISKSSSIFSKMQYYGILPFCISVATDNTVDGATYVLPNGNICTSKSAIGNDPGCSGSAATVNANARPGLSGGIFVYDISGVIMQ